MIPARCLTSFNRFHLPSSEAMPWLLQPLQGNMSRSWLRDTDIQNEDALLPIILLIIVKKKIKDKETKKICSYM